MEQQDQKVRSRQVLQVGCVHLFFLTARNLQLCVELELPRLRAAQKCGLWKFSPFVGKAEIDWKNPMCNNSALKVAKFRKLNRQNCHLGRVAVGHTIFLLWLFTCLKSCLHILCRAPCCLQGSPDLSLFEHASMSLPLLPLDRNFLTFSFFSWANALDVLELFHSSSGRCVDWSCFVQLPCLTGALNPSQAFSIGWKASSPPSLNTAWRRRLGVLVPSEEKV